MSKFDGHIGFFVKELSRAKENKKAAEDRGDTLAAKNIEKKIEHYEAACEALAAAHVYTQIGAL